MRKAEQIITEFQEADEQSDIFNPKANRTWKKYLGRATADCSAEHADLNTEPSKTEMAIKLKQLQTIAEILNFADTDIHSGCAFSRGFDEQIHFLSIPPEAPDPIPHFLHRRRHRLRVQAAPSGKATWDALCSATLTQSHYEKESVLEVQRELLTKKSLL